MKRFTAFVWCLLALVVSCGKDKEPADKEGEKTLEVFDPVAVKKGNSMKVWVHYMPWFEDKTSSDNGKWGQHWTMANKNPDVVDVNGRRQIASHYYPLIGPYASGDPDVLAYHFLLMKYAGIDGILIDWYGTRSFNDYASIKKNTEAIVSALEKVGLEFAIVYEDQTLRDGMNSDAQRIAQAQQDLQYLEKSFFSKSTYVRIDGKPLLLTFGPQMLKTATAWNTVLSALKQKPAFFPLYGHAPLAASSQYPNVTGEYIWVDNVSMDVKYSRKGSFSHYIGGAYPGFNDYYKEGGWGEQVLDDIDYDNGSLLSHLMNMAKEQQMDFLQLITWNDFGEGTMIEPTKEFGYTFLEKVQQFSGVSYNKQNLESVYTWYNLKKQFKDNPTKQTQLSQAFYYFISLQDEKAIKLVGQISQ